MVAAVWGEGKDFASRKLVRECGSAMLTFKVCVRVVGLVLAGVTGLSATACFEANAQPHSAPKVSGIATYAVELAFKGDFIRAGSVADRSGDAAAIKLVELL